MKRFGQVVVGAVVQSHDFIVEGVPGGDDDNAVLFFILPEVLEQLKAAAAGEIDVENYAVVGRVFDPLEGIGIVADAFANEMFLPKVAGDAVEQARFIFDDE